MNASMLPYILFSCLLLSVQAQNCSFREIIRHTKLLPVSCPCRETAVNSCSCLPIAEPGHELACFVEGTEHMLKHSISSNAVVERLNLSFQIQLDRNLCESLARGTQCQYKTKGNVKEFLTKILRTYQEINIHNLKKLKKTPIIV
uniref:Interleukin 9 n=1 Tax=Strigops habroptila TaxID=2489341 RepID=A0A672U2C6_STRHB